MERVVISDRASRALEGDADIDMHVDPLIVRRRPGELGAKARTTAFPLPNAAAASPRESTPMNLILT